MRFAKGETYEVNPGLQPVRRGGPGNKKPAPKGAGLSPELCALAGRFILHVQLMLPEAVQVMEILTGTFFAPALESMADSEAVPPDFEILSLP